MRWRSHQLLALIAAEAADLRGELYRLLLRSAVEPDVRADGILRRGPVVAVHRRRGGGPRLYQERGPWI